MARLHRNLPLPSESELLRFAGLLATLAASLLVVSSAWLVRFPTRHVTVVSPAAVTLPAWEHTAIKLKPDFRPAPRMPRRADSTLARADVADWMLMRLPAD